MFDAWPVVPSSIAVLLVLGDLIGQDHFRSRGYGVRSIVRAYNTVKEMDIFEVESNEFLLQMAELLQKGAEELLNAIKHLQKNPNVATGYVVRAKRIENEDERRLFKRVKAAFLRD